MTRRPTTRSTKKDLRLFLATAERDAAEAIAENRRLHSEVAVLQERLTESAAYLRAAESNAAAARAVARREFDAQKDPSRIRAQIAEQALREMQAKQSDRDRAAWLRGRNFERVYQARQRAEGRWYHRLYRWVLGA